MDGAIDVARVNQCVVLRMCHPCSDIEWAKPTSGESAVTLVSSSSLGDHNNVSQSSSGLPPL